MQGRIIELAKTWGSRFAAFSGGLTATHWIFIDLIRSNPLLARSINTVITSSDRFPLHVYFLCTVIGTLMLLIRSRRAWLVSTVRWFAAFIAGGYATIGGVLLSWTIAVSRAQLEASHGEGALFAALFIALAALLFSIPLFGFYVVQEEAEVLRGRIWLSDEKKHVFMLCGVAMVMTGLYGIYG